MEVQRAGQDRHRQGEVEGGAARAWGQRVDVHTTKTGRRPADALLIRPDAHIAWATPVDEPPATAVPALREALSIWFGTP